MAIHDTDKAAPAAGDTIQVKDKTKPKAKFGSKGKDEIVINPDIDQVVNEARERTAVFAWGRMNPPTIGHEKLVRKLQQEARKANGDAILMLSHSQDKKKNPLDYEDKIKLSKRAFGAVVYPSRSRTIIDAAKELQSKYNKLVMIAGSDRVQEYETLLNKYNGKDYTFDSIEVVSAGERDPDADGAEGMSASKMRQAAIDNNLSQFTSGLPRALKSQAKLIFDLVKAGMELHEELEAAGLLELEERVLDLQQRRKRALIMRRYKGKIMRGRALARRRMAREKNLRMRAQRMARNIVRKRVAGARGSNYQQLAPTDKMQVDRLVDKKVALVQKLAKRLYPRVKQAELKRLMKTRQTPTTVNNSFEPEYIDMIIEQLHDHEINEVFESLYEAEYKKEKKAEANRHKRTEADAASIVLPGPDDHDARHSPNRREDIVKKIYEEAEIDLKYISELFEAAESRMMENIISDTKQRHDQEKERLSQKHDSEMDRARLRRAREQNTATKTEQNDALVTKSTKSGVPYDILEEVYKRGLKAWEENHKPGVTQEQYAFARVNSYITKGKTYYTEDKDLHDMETDPKLQQRIDAAKERLQEQLEKSKASLRESRTPLESARILGRIADLKMRIENIQHEYATHDPNKVADLFFEADRTQSDKRMKMRRLAKLGLVGDDEYAQFDIIMGKMARADGDTSKLTQKERAFLSKIYDKLTDVITTDPTIFQKYRSNLAKQQKDANV